MPDSLLGEIQHLPVAAASPFPPALTDGPVRRIGVLRAHGLGDMLCALPTLRALSAQWPQAEVVLIGLPWAKHWAARQTCIQHFIEFPGWPGLPGPCPRTALLPHFLKRMQHERFDLLVQLHDSGEAVNPMVAACGARFTAGFADAGAYSADPALHLPMPRHGHEVLRLLALVDHLGVPRRGVYMEWPVRARDRAAASELVPVGAPLACLHPGARQPSRRWPARNFAAVGDRLTREGFHVVLMGTPEEAAAAAEVESHMREPAINLVGRTDLWTLGALVEAADVVISNDTGISHLAEAIGTPSVVVSCGPDIARRAPLDLHLHSCLWQDLPSPGGMLLPVEPERVAAAALRQAVKRPHPHTFRPPRPVTHRAPPAAPQAAPELAR